MSTKDILKQALLLKPQDKLSLIDGLLQSLDQPDKTVDQIWADEAERRLRAYRDGGMKGIPMEQIFKDV